MATPVQSHPLMPTGFGANGKTAGYKPLGSTNYGAARPSYEQTYNQFYGMAAPQFAGIDLQSAQQRNKIAQLQAQYQQAQNFTGQNKGFVNEGYGLNMAGLDVQRNAANREFQSITDLQRLLNDNYMREMGQVDQLQGLYGQGFQGQLGYTNTLEDLANQLLGLQTYARESDYFMDKRKTTGALAASGGFGGTGSEATLGHLFTQKDTDIRGYQLSNTKERAAIDEQRRALRQAYEEAQVGFADQRGDLTYGYNTQAESLWNQADATQDQLAMLDIKAQEFGLQRDQAIASLTQGLKNMELSNVINVNDLMGALSSNDIQRQILAQQVTQQAMSMAGPPPAGSYHSNTGAIRKGKAF